MLNDEELRVLNQYINALEESSNTLERMYLEKNLEGLKKVKDFMKEIQFKINLIISR